MDIVEELRGVLNSAKDRLSSPIFGPFAVSWSIWNYPVFFYAFSGEGSAASRVHQIEQHMHGDVGLAIVRYGVPALATWFYLGAYPHLIRLLLLRQDRLALVEREARSKVRGLIPITADHAQRLLLEVERAKRGRRDAEETQRTLADQVGTLNENIDRLNGEAQRVNRESLEANERAAQLVRERDALIERLGKPESEQILVALRPKVPPASEAPAPDDRPFDVRELERKTEQLPRLRARLRWEANRLRGSRPDRAPRLDDVAKEIENLLSRAFGDKARTEFRNAIDANDGDSDPVEQGPMNDHRFRAEILAVHLERLAERCKPAETRDRFIVPPIPPQVSA